MLLLACTPAEGSTRMVNEGSFVSSHRVTWNSAVCHIEPKSSRRDSSSSDGGHSGDWPERRIPAATSIDIRAHHETKRPRLHPLLGHGVNRPGRPGLGTHAAAPR